MPIQDFYLEIDPSGINPANLISNERHTLVSSQYRVAFPKYGAYFSESVLVYSVNTETNVRTLLTKNVQYYCIELLPKSTFQLGKEIQCAILIIDNTLPETIDITYQALGGHDSPNADKLINNINLLLNNPNTVDWNNLIKPKEFNPATHKQDAADAFGLEYIVDELERVRKAYITCDTGLHNELLHYLQDQNNSFYVHFNTEINDNIDVITTLATAANNSNILTEQTLLNIADNLNRIQPNITETQIRNAFYELNNLNAEYARTLISMSDQLYQFNQTVLDIPPRILGLELWLDFSDNNHFTNDNGFITIYDQSIHKRVFISDSITLNQSPLFNKSAAQFVTGSNLIQEGNIPFQLKTPMTVFCITGQTTGYENLVLFSNDDYALTSDTYNGNLLMLAKQDLTEINACVRSSLYDTKTSHINVMSLSDDLKEDTSYSNSIETTYRNYNGYEIKPTFNGKVIPITQIGHPTLEQQGEILSLIVYNRQLSKCEIDAVLEYLNKKFSIKVNLIANGNFSDGNAEFRSDYTLSYNASNKGEIATVEKKILCNCPNGDFPLYQYPNFMNYISQLTEGNKILIVNTSADITKNFWIQDIPTDPNVTYEFSFEILYSNLQVPNIAFYVDGIQNTKTYTLDPNITTPVKLTFTFVPKNKQSILSLRNLNNSGTVNTFAIDNLQLNRKLY